MSFEIIPFPSDLALAEGAAIRLVGELVARPDRGVPYSVALSGGRIAKDFFTQAARQLAGRPELLEGVHFFWGDERCVPASDPESNYGIAWKLLLEPLKIPADRIHRLRGEADEEVALREAMEQITEVVPADAEGQPMLDLVFLGMGEEGHVASLFPGEPEAVAGSGMIYRAVTTPKPPPRRITLGYGALIAAKKVWLLASGKGKLPALKESLSREGNTPLARVLHDRKMTHILTDISLESI